MVSPTRRTAETMTGAFTASRSWRTIAVLLIVIVSLPLTAWSTTDSIGEECGISIALAPFGEHANLVAITAARVELDVDRPMRVCNCTLDTLPVPVDTTQPLGTVLRL